MRKHISITSVIILAFSLRLGFGLFNHYIYPGFDSPEYDVVAQNLAHGHGFSIKPDLPTPSRAPLYPLFLAAFYYIFGWAFTPLSASMLHYTPLGVVQSAMDALSCLIIYFIALRLFNRSQVVAVLSAALYAIYPAMIRYCHLMYTEVLFIFLFLLSILLLLRAIEKESYLLFILSGICLGLGTLTRGTTLLFPFFTLVLLLRNKKLLKKLFVFIACSIITVAPWTIRNYVQFHRFIPICTLGFNEAFWHTGQELQGKYSYARIRQIESEMRQKANTYDYIEYEKQIGKEGMELIKQKPYAYTILVIKRFPKFWLSGHWSMFASSYPPWPPSPLSQDLENKLYMKVLIRLGLFADQFILLLLAIIGMALATNRGYNAHIPILILVYFSGYILFDPNPRYHLPAMPYVMMFSAFAIVSIKNILKKKSITA